MTVARVDLYRMRGRVIAALNAAPAGTWTINNSPTTDQRRNDTEMDYAIRDADAQVCLAICETPGHGYRSLFLTDTTLTHGAMIPDHIGPIESVRIQPYTGAQFMAGRPKDADDIDSYRNDTLGLYDTVAHNITGSSLAGYYSVIGNEIRFTGFAAKALLANFTRTTDCQSPEVYADAVLSLAVMNLVKEGDAAPFAQFFAQQGQQYLNLIRGGSMIIQPVQMAQAA
jgi:hypothetical protein